MNIFAIAGIRSWRPYFLSILLTILTLPSVTTARADGPVLLLDLEGPIGVASAEFITGGIEEAKDRNSPLVIIRMDTPGGLVNSMRDIVQAILGSDVPVATYVSPQGARADSAGTYILLASHIAAMAPTSHLGAATPVSLIGGDSKDKNTEKSREKDDSDDKDEPDSEGADESESSGDGKSVPDSDSAMDRKVMNDAIAYIRSLAEAHGRNADWAEKAVTEAATLTAAEALEHNVIDLIAVDQAELLQKINGRDVKVNNRTIKLATEGLEVEVLEPSWRIKVLTAIASPEIAVLLLMVGVYGLLFEGYNPGAIVPGVAGVVCLLLAAYALQVLPVNYAGLALIIVGIVLIVAESMVPSFGALGIGGIVAFIFGAIMMFDSGIPGFGISITFVVSLAVVAGLLLLWLLSYLVGLRRRGAVSGAESILGGTGTAMQSFTGTGKVWLEGEAWAAVSKVPIEEGQAVVVLAIDGLTLVVEPAGQVDRTQAQFQT